MSVTCQMLRSRAFFCVLLFQFLNPAIQYVQSTGTVYVQRYWAGVQAALSAVRVPACNRHVTVM